MKKQNMKRKETRVLSGFGVALAALASSVAIAAESPVAPKMKATTPALTQKAPVADRLCRIGDEQCMMAKPFAQKLSALKQKELKALIAKGVQVDVRDACLIC